ncbi:MAG: hypothetical protein KA756_10130, partial [Steroidobacteraceae bacterium]|nr:hypothetical protein [Steroidobacteraceae bacterium]
MQAIRHTPATGAIRYAVVAAALGAAGIAAQAQAQAQNANPAPAGPVVLEEVVVTAERRETALQDTPISLAVMGPTQLEA